MRGGSECSGEQQFNNMKYEKCSAFPHTLHRRYILKPIFMFKPFVNTILSVKDARLTSHSIS